MGVLTTFRRRIGAAIFGMGGFDAALGHRRLVSEDAGQPELERRALVGAASPAQVGVELIGREHGDPRHAHERAIQLGGGYDSAGR